MSIPERFLRIAKHKFGEFKERLDQLDEEAKASQDAELSRKQSRTEATRELDAALASIPPAEKTVNPPRSNTPSTPMTRPRTPEEIARGSSVSASTAPRATTATTGGASDPLDYHYRLFGLEPGADLTAVQAAYNIYSARSDPSRFPAGSLEEQQAREIHQRVEESYKVLRDYLDPTTRRFDLLEFDSPAPQKPDAAGQDA